MPGESNYQRQLQGKHFRRVATLGLAVLAGGTLGFRLIEGWSWFECLYFTVISVTTVGYAELHELSDAGRMVVMLVIAGGILTTLLVANLVGTTMLFRFQDHRKTRMERQISQMSDHVILCGHGRLGKIVRQELEESGRSYVVVEERAAEVEELASQGIAVLQGDATDEDELIRAGVARAAGVIAAIGSDAGNVFITLTAREHNPDCPIVARAEDTATERKLKMVGATRVVTPYHLGGKRLAHAFLRPGAVELADLALGGPEQSILIEEIELPAGDTPRRTDLRALDLGRRFRVNAIGVRTAGGGLRLNPRADDPLAPGDRILVIGARADLDACADGLRDGTPGSA